MAVASRIFFSAIIALSLFAGLTFHNYFFHLGNQNSASRELHAKEDLVIGEKVLLGLLHQKKIEGTPSFMSSAVEAHPKTINSQIVDYSLPPLDSMLHENGTIVGDVQILLQFAIVGFGKCGTTTLMHWLASHAELQSLTSEVWALLAKEPDRLVRRLYRNLDHPHKQRGYKCPGDAMSPNALGYYRRYWPQTKLFVAIRHPIDWFMSLYNFRVQNLVDFENLKHPNELIGECHRKSLKTCTRRGFFGYFLWQMGKQHFNGIRPFTSLEKEISNKYKNYQLEPADISYMSNPVFLVDVHQLGDANETRRALLRHDVQHYLGLSEPLQDLIHHTPGMKWNATIQAAKDAKKINICNDEYIPLRQELLHLSQLSSQWIRHVFLDLPDVYVSSRSYLLELLESWMYDPCDNTTRSNRTTTDSSSPHLEKVVLEPPSFVEWIAKKNTSEATSTATRTMHLNAAGGCSPLETIIDNHGNVIGDPQFLLDFAIIGFGKCGTSTLMRWLGAHSEVSMLPDEAWSLYYKQPANLISRLYTDLPNNSSNGGIFPETKRAYKAPSDIRKAHVLSYYRTLWPKTKLIVGVRHPVLWFQSLFNFRIQNQVRVHPKMSHPNGMMGRCFEDDDDAKVCTSMGHFAYNLLQLGKQHYVGPRPFSELEKTIVTTYYVDAPFTPEDILYMPNDVFLFDVAQLQDQNEARQRAFRQGIKTFVGLEQDLPPVTHVTPGKKWNATVQAAKDAMKIDICKDEFIPLRRDLMHLSRLSSQWIRHVFLDLPGVHVSSRDHLQEILESWMHDPCGNKSDLVTQAESDAIFRETVGPYFWITKRAAYSNEALET